MTNKDLISQYVDTGIGIPRYQFDKLSNNDKKTYLRKMRISILNDYRYVEYYYGELPEDIQLSVVNKNENLIVRIKNPTEKVQLVAVNKNGWIVRDIKNPTEKVQIAAVKNQYKSIDYIKNPSEQVQLAAVNYNGDSIQYINNPSEQVQLAAVNNDGNAIRYIDNPSEELQLAAVKESPYSIRWIDNPSEELQLYVIRWDERIISAIKNPTEKVQSLLLDKILKNGDYKLAQYISSEKIQMLAVEKSFENAKEISSVNYELLNTLVTPSENILKLISDLQNKILYNSIKSK